VRVLFLTHSFPRFAGDAAGSFLHRLASALRDENVDVQVIAPAAPGLKQSESVDGIPVERFRYAPHSLETLAYTGTMAQDVAGSWTARLALLGYMGAGLAKSLGAQRRFAPDVIHAHWWFPSGVLGAAVSRYSRAPLVTTMHGTDVRLARSIHISQPLFRNVMRRSSRVTVVSSWLAAEVTAIVPGISPIVAPMPIAAEKFSPGGLRKVSRFLFVGRLNRQKGLQHLLQAMARLDDSVELDVVGNGPDDRELKALAAASGLHGRITWHGQLNQSFLQALYRAATALIVPSIDEGLGLVAAEALMCETPVIAFRSGGLTDVIEHERTGLLASPADPDELVAAMMRILARPAEAIGFGKAGRIAASELFLPAPAARRYAGIYRDVAGPKS